MIYGAILWLAYAVCAFIIVGTVAHTIYVYTVLPDITLARFWWPALPFTPMFGSTVVVRHYLFRHRAVPLWSYVTLLACTVFSMWISFAWFRNPMHDIALFFGSHGRWGCTTGRADGSYYYLIRDATVPWMLFPPIIVATLAHGITSWLAGFRYRVQTQCASCGYLLRGLTDPRCPECGTPFDPRLLEKQPDGSTNDREC